MSHEYDTQIKHLDMLIASLKKNKERYALDINNLEILKLKLVAYSLAHKPLVGM